MAHALFSVKDLEKLRKTGMICEDEIKATSLII